MDLENIELGEIPSSTTPPSRCLLRNIKQVPYDKDDPEDGIWLKRFIYTKESTPPRIRDYRSYSDYFDVQEIPSAGININQYYKMMLSEDDKTNFAKKIQLLTPKEIVSGKNVNIQVLTKAESNLNRSNLTKALHIDACQAVLGKVAREKLGILMKMEKRNAIPKRFDTKKMAHDIANCGIEYHRLCEHLAEERIKCNMLRTQLMDSVHTAQLLIAMILGK